MKKKDLSHYDEILSYFFYLEASIKQILRYRRSYRNYLGICVRLFRREFPITAILRDGNHITLNSPTAVQSIAEMQELRSMVYHMEDDAWDISYPIQSGNERSVKLYGSRDSGEVVHVFLDEIYQKLPVEGRAVIDIGANIGDSSIYFAIRGAEKIIGIEPYIKNYEIAKKNIEVNNLSNKIILILGGCAANSGYTRVDQHSHGIERCVLYNHTKDDHNLDNVIPLFTLEKILEINDLKSGIILKMDCEGCEYDAIHSASMDLLQRFSHIQIEYHYGYKTLKQKLEDSNFDVRISRPRALRRPYIDEFSGNRWMYLGYLYATNKSHLL